MTLNLSLACGAYPHTRAIQDGTIAIENVNIIYKALGPREIFWRMIREQEFDVSEMSLSAYILLLSRGDRSFVGLPIFPARVFRHSYVFVAKDSGIRTPEGLKGARVGVPEYHMTAALFIRGLLSDDYGVRPEDLRWVQGGQEKAGRVERVTLNLPSELSLEPVMDRSLLDLMADGKLDALAAAAIPDGFHEGRLPIRRLFTNAAQVELDWYRRTKIFPIMHLVVIRRDVYESDPSLAMRLISAFSDARDLFYSELRRNMESWPLPLFSAHVEETWERFGRDFLPYGVEANRSTLDAAVRYSYEQHLSARPVTLEELFPGDIVDFIGR